MEKHITKILHAGLLALSAGFVLAACDPVSAAPSNYKDPIVVKNSDGSKVDFDDNLLGNLYDSITSERNSKVVSLILKTLGEDKYGSFHQYVTEDNKLDFSKDKDMELRLSEHFFNEMSSGSYNDDLGRFSEEKFYKSCKYELYDMVDMAPAVKTNTFFLDASITKENALSKLKGTYFNTAKDARGYIEEKVYPDILKNKLVEDYVIEKNYSSLGRAYAREVSFVKVSYEDSPMQAKHLMRSFAHKFIKGAANISEESPEAINFDILNTVLKGFNEFNNSNYLVTKLTGDANDLAAEVYGTSDSDYVTIPAIDASAYKDYISGTYNLLEPGKYYKKTKLGEIIDSYQTGLKAVGDRFASDSDEEKELEKFTSEGKSKEYGLMQKIVSLAKEDYTTKGWYVKNGGITELPSVLRDRLFNIKVATTLDNDSLLPIEQTEGVYDKSGYLRNIKGRRLLLPSNAAPYSDTEPFNYICHDTEGKAFYICQVLEAPSTGKLDKNKETDYSAAEKEAIVKEVAKVLGTKDSYIKDAYTELLNKYTFEFYDTSLYEYFKSEYPDLSQFDED